MFVKFPTCFLQIIGGSCQVIYNQCPRSLHSDIWWPRTMTNVHRTMSCPDGSIGTASRMCDAKVGWLEPNLSNCTGNDFIKFAAVLKQMTTNHTELNKMRFVGEICGWMSYIEVLGLQLKQFND